MIGFDEELERPCYVEHDDDDEWCGDPTEEPMDSLMEDFEDFGLGDEE